MELAAGTVVERYTLESELGRGGMAVVYLVRHNQLGSLHAMKVLSAPTRSIKKRLLQEGRVQSALHHPNVVAVTDMVDLDGIPALVMEYVRGPSLADFLRESSLSTAQADELAVGILAGIDAAHRHGLVHRDLKPGNIMLSMAGGTPVPKITDFGLAKMLGGDGSHVTTRTGVVMGTPAYMAPEQIRDSRNVDHRADLWSAGAILYELVMGTRAFKGKDTMALFEAVCAGRRAPATGETRMVAAIEAALKVESEERVPDCAALLALWRGNDDDAWGSAVWESQAPAQPVVGDEGEAEPVSPPPTSEVDMLQVLPTAAPREILEIRGLPLEVAVVDPMTFSMSRGRVVRLTQRIEMSTERVSPGLIEALEGPESPSFDDCVALCNALSAEMALTPAYTLGEWAPRKRFNIDDIGRMLYDLVKFERVGLILAHFGEHLPHVLQFEPERLGEVDGIGKRTAERIAEGWDRRRYWTQPIALDPEATGWRLPTEAEVAAAVHRGQTSWEWCWDLDGAPASTPAPDPLVAGEFDDPSGAASGPRRIVRRGSERACRLPWVREPDLGFRVVRPV